MSVSPCNQIGHDYLLSRPYVYNGGLMAQVLTNIIATDNSSSLVFSLNSSFNVFNYITQFFFNTTCPSVSFANSSVTYTIVSSTNLLSSVFGLLYLTGVFLFCVLMSFLWMCWRFVTNTCFRTVQKQQITIYGQYDKTANRKRNLNIIVVLCIVCYCLLVSFIISCSFSGMSQLNLQQQLTSTSAYNSFMSAWQRSSYHLNNFISQMNNDSYNLFNQTINNMSLALNNALFGSLSNLTSDLLSAFGVTDLFTRANTLINNLSNTTKSMQYVMDNTDSILSKINQQNGSISATVSLLQSCIRRVCSSLPQNTTCMTFLNQSDFFKVPINTNQISSSSSVTMIFLLNQYQINISSLSIQFSTMQTEFYNQLIVQTKAQINSLNLYQSVNTISNAWLYISKTVSPWNQNFNTLSSSITSFLTIYGVSIFVSTSVLLLLLIVLSVVYVIVLLRYSLFYYLHKRSTSLLGSTIHIQTLKEMKGRYRTSNLVIYIYIIMNSCLVFLILILSLLIINVSHLFYNEACIQIWRPQGLVVSDNFLDLFLNQYWNSIRSFIVSQNIPIQFTFPKPTQILGNIRYNCINDNGIFYALGMSNFVNVSSFLWSGQNYQSLKNGLNITYRTLMATNVMEAIPLSISSLLNSTASITAYFDNITYQPSINELSKGVIALPNYPAWIDSAIQYFNATPVEDSNQAIKILILLKNTVPDLQSLDRSVQNLNINFQIIQNSRSNNFNMLSFFASLQNVQSVLVDNINTYQRVQQLYNQRMMTEFPANAISSLSDLLGYLVNHLFPCQSLSVALTTILDNLCSSDLTIETMTSYGLNITVTCACSMTMLHVLWYVVRIIFKVEREENISVC